MGWVGMEREEGRGVKGLKAGDGTGGDGGEGRGGEGRDGMRQIMHDMH